MSDGEPVYFYFDGSQLRGTTVRTEAMLGGAKAAKRTGQDTAVEWVSRGKEKRRVFKAKP